MPLNYSPDDTVKVFMDEYKKLGYSTKTAMINDALRLLKRHMAKELRAKRRIELLAEYAREKPKHLLETIDGEDFEGSNH